MFQNPCIHLNLDSTKEYAEFKYCFVFDDDEVVYEYKKRDSFYLIDEKLTINGKEVLYFNYFDFKIFFQLILKF